MEKALEQCRNFYGGKKTDRFAEELLSCFAIDCFHHDYKPWMVMIERWAGTASYCSFQRGMHVTQLAVIQLILFGVLLMMLPQSFSMGTCFLVNQLGKKLWGKKITLFLLLDCISNPL
jgi:hypothetical protein